MEFKNISAVSIPIGDNLYLYDRFSNEFMTIDETIETILDDTYCLSDDDIVSKYKGSIVENDIIEQLSTIKEAQNTLGVLEPSSMPKLSLSSKQSNMEKIRHKIDQKLTSLVFSVTENCNLRCKYCVYSGGYSNIYRQHGSKSIDWETAKKAIDYFLEHCSKNDKDSKQIAFYGGEALLSYKLIRMIVEYTKKRNRDIKFVLTSNLTLMTDSMADFIIANSFLVTVSLDGPASVHDFFRISREDKATHNIVIENLIKLRARDEEFFKNNILYNVVIAPHSYDLAILDEFFNSDLFRDVPAKNFKPLELNAEENTFFREWDYQNFINRFYDYSINRFIDAHVNNRTDFSDMKISYQYHINGFKMLVFRQAKKMSEYKYFWPNGVCIFGLRSLFISPQGEMYPCENLYDHNHLVIGNVDNGINVDMVSNMVDSYCKESIGYCGMCWAYRLCGDCHISALNENIYSHEKKVRHCKISKSSILATMTEYLTIISKTPTAFDYLTTDDKLVPINTMKADEI